MSSCQVSHQSQWIKQHQLWHTDCLSILGVTVVWLIQQAIIVARPHQHFLTANIQTKISSLKMNSCDQWICMLRRHKPVQSFHIKVISGEFLYKYCKLPCHCLPLRGGRSGVIYCKLCRTMTFYTTLLCQSINSSINCSLQSVVRPELMVQISLLS